MPIKQYQTQIVFNNPVPIGMATNVLRGLRFRVSAQQTKTGVTVDPLVRNQFLAGGMDGLATAINSATGTTVQFIYISWADSSAGGASDPYTIAYMTFTVVVDATAAATPTAIVTAAIGIPWVFNMFSQVFVGTDFKPDYDNPCNKGYHWDEATQACVLDTPVNCPIGYHWDATANACVQDYVPPEPFPMWIVALAAGVPLLGLLAYYLLGRH